MQKEVLELVKVRLEQPETLNSKRETRNPEPEHIVMYYLVYGFLYLLSLIPMRILYVLSDAIYGIVYHLLGYRREVVMQNLELAFPDKTSAERKKIAKQFYHNFLDNLIEAIKLISASDAFLQKRFTGNWEVINEYYSTGRSAQIHLGHTFNWEWGNYVAGTKLKYLFIGVYMPIKNMATDRLFKKIRSKSGTVLVPATPPELFRSEFVRYKSKQYLLGLVADQSPSDPTKSYWLNFFGHPTAFVTGPERGARLENLPVFFAYITKPGRGYYQITFTLLEENPKLLKDGELTLHFARNLEDVIRKHPDMWLWSHRRWKKEWKPEYRRMWIDEEVDS